MDPLSIAGRVELGMVLLMGFSLAGALALGVRSLRGQAAGPLGGAAPVGVLALAIALWARFGGGSASAATCQAAVETEVVHLLLAPLLVAPVALLSLIFFAVRGARAPERWGVGAGVGGAATLLLVGVVLVGGWSEDMLTFAVARAALYGVLGAIGSIAMLRGGGGRGAAASAGAVLLLVVAVGEASVSGLGEYLSARVLLGLQADQRAAFLSTSGAEVIGPLRGWGLAAMGAAVAFSLSGLSPRRARDLAGAALWACGAGAIFALGWGGERLVALATLLP
ncbi:MAG: hypothetical protein JXX28_11475 [Deltaproteobacteria bacterium]|nr:hypothetical protein [Deltaproteobacteria bacterium]